MRQIQLVRCDSSPHRRETACPRGCAVRARGPLAGSPPSPACRSRAAGRGAQQSGNLPITGDERDPSTTACSSAGRRAAVIRTRRGDSSLVSGSPTRVASAGRSRRSSARSPTWSRRCASGRPAPPAAATGSAFGLTEKGKRWRSTGRGRERLVAQGADLPPRTRGTPARHHSCRHLRADCKGRIARGRAAADRRRPISLPTPSPHSGCARAVRSASPRRRTDRPASARPTTATRTPPRTRGSRSTCSRRSTLSSTTTRRPPIRSWRPLLRCRSRLRAPKACAGPAKDLRPHIGGEGDANRRPGT